MAATHTVLITPVTITVSGTSENTIDLDAVMQDNSCSAMLEWVSGTTIQINANDRTIVSASAALNTSQPRMVVNVQKGQYLRCKGSAGSETFNISLLD